jgi:hypothetical protein
MDTRRTMIGIQPETRDRFNRIGAMLGSIEERKLSQDETLTWLMDRYEIEIGRRFVGRSPASSRHNGKPVASEV